MQKPKPEEVVIRIEDDPGRYTDVVKIIHADGFFDKVWDLKQWYDPDYSYPVLDSQEASDHFKTAFYGVQDSQKHTSFKRNVSELRQIFGLSTLYERLIHKLIFTGVVEDNDYLKAIYKTMPLYYSDDPDDFEEVDVIVIHQGTRTGDLEQPLREYLNLFEVKTKTGRSFSPDNIKDAPEYIKPYLLDSRYNKHAVDAFNDIEKYYPHYQAYILHGSKPLDLVLRDRNLSRDQYKKIKASNEDEDQDLVTDIRNDAKSISEGIGRIKELIAS